MRYLVCLLVGLVAGAVLASIVADAVAKRHAWPRGVMNVMQHDLADARTAARAGACTAPGLAPAHARLQAVAADLDHVLLAPGEQDRVLAQYAGDLRHALAQWDPQAGCAAQGQALNTVADACDRCHRDYR